jgi:hypothetical protein
MAFGPQRRDKPAQKTWDGTEERAHEIDQWARDAALLPYAAVTRPDRNAAAGSPEAGWLLKIQTPVPASDGGGTVWKPVPIGARIRFSGTDEDPTFTVVEPKAEAATFRA